VIDKINMEIMVLNSYRIKTFVFRLFFMYCKTVYNFDRLCLLIFYEKNCLAYQILAKLVVYNFVTLYGKQNMISLLDISKKLKKVWQFLGFCTSPKLAQGPRAQKLRIDILKYTLITCKNFNNFGILSR